MGERTAWPTRGASSRTDPLLPALGVVVSLILVAAAVHFYPYFARRLSAPGPAIASVVPPGDDAVPVWVCRSVDGVALLLRGEAEDRSLAEALEGGPYGLLTLHVYNFARAAPYELKLPEGGFASPEGGDPLVPAARLVRADAPPRLRPVLLGLGAVDSLRVEKGHEGQALLVVRGDASRRTAFVSGALTFERRELERRVLARFEQRPDPKQFEDF